MPISTEKRIAHYHQQSGSPRLTARQRRRVRKKENAQRARGAR
ncbi:MAG TPA: hypothetical protein VIL44_03350 [Micromonospora sp.]